VRETFSSSLELADSVLQGLGVPAEEARAAVAAFRGHDDRNLDRQHAFFRDKEKLVQSQFEAASELEGLLDSDRGAEKKQTKSEKKLPDRSKETKQDKNTESVPDES
jgi:hypothetical protein